MFSFLAALAPAAAAARAPIPWPAPPVGFGAHIEGASVDAHGDLYATHFRNSSNSTFAGNLANRNVIGRIGAATGESSVFFVGNDGSSFNGMKWDPAGKYLFLADVGRGRVVKVDLSTMEATDHCGSDDSLAGTGAPNDLALARDGTVYLSGQDWGTSTGGLWMCKPDGTLIQLESMNRTNGVALSPLDDVLYLTEAVGSPVPTDDLPHGQRIWRYAVGADGMVGDKTEFFNFARDAVAPEASIDSDGMRTDTQGNLWVTRNGLGQVQILAPDGNLLGAINLTMTSNPTNLAFGGPDGTTLFVVGRCDSSGWGTGNGCVEAVDTHTEQVGRQWALLQAGAPARWQGWGAHIEGVSVDGAGRVYATHFRNTTDGSVGGNGANRNVVGVVDPATGQATAFFVGEPGSSFNGMKWDPQGSHVYLADVGLGRVVKVDLTTMESTDHCGGKGSLIGTGAPNDLALAQDGTIYLSGQDWGTSTGGLWRCKPDGTLVQLDSMNRTNGIALSPEGDFLYLTEAVGSPVLADDLPYGQRIWRYVVGADGMVSDKTEFYNFATDATSPEASTDSDGMRTDAQGNLWVTRNGLGKVVVIGSGGSLKSEVQLRTTRNPTNLAFGGEDGTTVYVVGRCFGSGWSSGDGCFEAVSAELALEPGGETTSASPGGAPPSSTPPAGVRGFGAHIEGASVDASGSVFAVHFRNTTDSSSSGNNVNRNVIGVMDPETRQSSVFFVGQEGSIFNGMKWDPAGSYLYLADVGRGRVVRISLATMEATDHCGTDDSLVGTGAPNDLALAQDGTIYLSGQDWGTSTGGLWMCSPDGALTKLESMNRTNGIALSPADDVLYLTEAVGPPVLADDLSSGQRIWKYAVGMGGTVEAKMEFYNFATDAVPPEASTDSDGMRTDVQGNLWVTRNGLGKVAVIAPDGSLKREVELSETSNPTNLAFGGQDGTTLYVVGRCRSSGWGSGDGCIEEVSTESVGREWSLIYDGREETTKAPTEAPKEGEGDSQESSAAAPVLPMGTLVLRLLTLATLQFIR